MPAGNFLETRERHPVTLGVAVAVHGVALAALLLAKPDLMPMPPEVIRLIDPTVKPPPEPVDVLPETPKPPMGRVERPTPEVPIERNETAREFVTDTAELGGGIAPGEGIAIEPLPRILDPVITAPQFDSRFARDVQPPYPPGMQRLEIEGRVTVRVLVGTDGRALRIEPVASDHEAFFEATRAWGLRRWRFTPATRDGVPVEAWRTASVRFEID